MTQKAKTKVKRISKRKTLSKDKGLFDPSVHPKKLAEIDHLTTVREAKTRTKQLKEKFDVVKKKGSRVEQVRVKRAANFAANRANAMAQKKSLRTETKATKLKIAEIYRQAYNEMIY